jgi:hypothetical protein
MTGFLHPTGHLTGNCRAVEAVDPVECCVDGAHRAPDEGCGQAQDGYDAGEPVPGDGRPLPRLDRWGGWECGWWSEFCQRGGHQLFSLLLAFHFPQTRLVVRGRTTLVARDVCHAVLGAWGSPPWERARQQVSRSSWTANWRRLGAMDRPWGPVPDRLDESGRATNARPSAGPCGGLLGGDPCRVVAAAHQVLELAVHAGIRGGTVMPRQCRS